MREVVIETLEEHLSNLEELVIYLEGSKALNSLTDATVVADLARELQEELESLKEEVENNEDEQELDYDE